MELRTKDLILRTVTEADAPEVARTWDQDREISEARVHIARMAENHRKNRPGAIRHLCLAVAERACPGRIAGWCGLDGTGEGTLHIFYSLRPDFRGRGYAVQAAAALLDYAFTQARVPFVNGGCAKDNAASFRVMEKIHMRPAGTLKNGDPLFYIDRETYLHDIEITGTARL